MHNGQPALYRVPRRRARRTGYVRASSYCYYRAATSATTCTSGTIADTVTRVRLRAREGGGAVRNAWLFIAAEGLGDRGTRAHVCARVEILTRTQRELWWRHTYTHTRVRVYVTAMYRARGLYRDCATASWENLFRGGGGGEAGNGRRTPGLSIIKSSP